MTLLLFAGVLSAQCPNLVWEDNFDGDTLDFDKWSFQIGDGCDQGEGLCGWGNNEEQWYLTENLTVGDGLLRITGRKETVNERLYTSSRIRTKGKGDWRYGRFEASMKMPVGQGLWPAFWMLSSEETYGLWPQSGEIDIMEYLGNDPDNVFGTIHYGKLFPQNKFIATDFTLNAGTFADDFNEFAIEWEEDEIRWFVNDVLYATKKPEDVDPERWPFDQDFHFIINMAIGGNLPGDPGQTLFPRTMEVDYVRVYDGFFPYIEGVLRTENKEAGARYSVGNVPQGATIQWTVPESATIVSGQGETEIIVDWGDFGGDVKATITDECSTTELTANVFVEPPFVPILTLENFDEPSLLTLNLATGTLDTAFTNPEPNDINPSNLVGRYVRNSGEQFDVLIYDLGSTTIIGDASDFVGGEKSFFMDVRTSSPVGNKITLQLENSNLAQPDNFPRGRHSRFEAVTTEQSEWHRLEFKFVDRPDNSVSNFSINRLIFLFASGTNTGNTYFYDNFEIYAPSEVVNTREQIRTDSRLLELMPNPFRQSIRLENKSEQTIRAIQVFTNDGKMVLQSSLLIPPSTPYQLDLGVLPKGLYFLKAITDEGGVLFKKMIKQ